MFWKVNLVALSMLIFAATPSWAQTARQTYGGATRTARSHILSRPTVSPYLRLLQGGANTGFGNVSPIYQTQVRPAIDNRQQSQQQQRQMQQMQGQLNQVRQQYRQANSGYMATGHPTRYMSYSHYYPGLGR